MAVSQASLGTPQNGWFIAKWLIYVLILDDLGIQWPMMVRIITNTNREYNGQ